MLHKIKTAKTRLFAVCWAAAVILTAAFFVTSCGDKMPNAPRITITIEGDGNVTGVPASIKIGRGLKWAKIKPLAEKKIGFKTGFELKEWQFKEKSTLINDTDVFIKDTVIFAVSRVEPVKVKLTVKGDANINGVPAKLKINKDAAWTEVKPQVLAKVKAKEGYEILEWKYNSASGAAVADTDTFGTDKTVYAVSAKIVPKYTITIDGDSYVTGKPAKLENIPEGTLWAAVKAQAEAKITVDETRDLAQWRLGKNGSTIADSYEIKSDITAYAETVPTANPKITITVAAGAGAEVTIASPASFKVNKGSSWADIKAKAEAKVTCNEGYIIKEWKNGSLAALFDGYTFNGDETVYVETKDLEYTITFATEGENGTLTAEAEGVPKTSTSPITVPAGKTVTFTATPHKTEHFVQKWTTSSGSFEKGTGTQGNPTAKLKVTEDVTVKVYFSGTWEVAYNDLEAFLQSSKVKDGIVNKIKITGTIPAQDFKGRDYNPGTLGKKIRKTNKKIAIILPENINNVTSMYKCFYFCENLVSVENIPKSVTNMSYCFEACKSLTEAPAIPKSVTDMRACFESCKSLTEAPAIPKSVTDMSRCFFLCTSLTQAPAIPQGVKNMRACFSYCEKLTKAPAILKGVTNMSSCFSQCENLTHAPAIPNSVTNMSYCFSGCKNLSQAPAIPNGVTDMSGCFKECVNLSQAPAIPQGVTNMSECFKDCKSLTRGPDIPDSVTNMSYCFSECKDLSRAPDIPQGVTDITESFYGCKSITGLKLYCPLPKKKALAFGGCDKIKYGGIKVKYAYFPDYEFNAWNLGTTEDRFSGF